MINILSTNGLLNVLIQKNAKIDVFLHTYISYIKLLKYIILIDRFTEMEIIKLNFL